MKNLYIAYAATWFIHIGYLLLLTRRFARLRQEFDELRRK